MMQLLDRYCYYQFFVMLMIGTAIPGGMFLLTDDVQRLMRYVAEAGCPLDLLITMTALQIPATVVVCLPVGVLMATILSLYYLTADSEILAIRASGISMMRIYRPFVLIGIFAAALSFLLAEEVVPDALKLSNRMAMDAANNRELPPSNGIHDYVGYENDTEGKLKTIYLVASRQGRKLFNNILFDFGTPGYTKLIWAPTGLFKDQRWNLYDGHIYHLFSKNSDSANHIHFGTLQVEPPDLSRFDPEKREPKSYEMNTHLLLKKINKLMNESKPVPNEDWLELFRRYSDPAACVFLMVAALPVALFGNRGKNMFALGYGGILIIAYFVLRDIFVGLVNSGRFDPLTAAWLPGFSFAFIGVLLLFLLRKRL